MSSTGGDTPQRASAQQMAMRKIKDLRRSDPRRPDSRRGARSGSPSSQPPIDNPFTKGSPSQPNGLNSQPQNGTLFGSQSQSFPPNPQPSNFGFSAPSSSSFPTFGSPIKTDSPGNFTGFSGSVFSIPNPGGEAKSDSGLGGQPTTGFNFGSAPPSQPQQKSQAPVFSFGQPSSQQTSGSSSPQHSTSQPNIFGQLSAQPSQQPSLFGQPSSQPTTQADNPFAQSTATPNPFGANTDFDAPSQPSNTFGNKEAASTSQSTSVFGTAPTLAATSQPSSIFGAAPSSTTTSQSTSIFGTAPSSTATSQSTSSFGTAPTSTATSQPPSLFRTTPSASTQAQSSSDFGSPKPVQAPNIFGNSTTSCQTSQAPNILGASAPAQPEQTVNSFGNASQSAQSQTDTSASATPKQTPFTFGQPATSASSTSQAAPSNPPSWRIPSSDNTGGLFGRISNSEQPADNGKPATGNAFFGRISKLAEPPTTSAPESATTNGLSVSNQTPVASKPAEAPQPSRSTAPSTNGFNFGSPGPQTSKPAESTTSSTSEPIFNFGTPSPQKSDAPSGVSASMAQTNSTAPLKGVLTNSTSSTTHLFSATADTPSASKPADSPLKKKVTFGPGPGLSSSVHAGETPRNDTSAAEKANPASFFSQPSQTKTNNLSSPAPPSIAPSATPTVSSGVINTPPPKPPAFTAPPRPTESPSNQTTASSSAAESQLKVRVSSYGPDGVPRVLDNNEKARYDVAARLRSLNESFQKHLSSIDPGSADFDALLRYYASVREQIGAPLGLYERATAGMKRKAGAETPSMDSDSSSKRSRFGSDAIPSVSATKPSGAGLQASRHVGSTGGNIFSSSDSNSKSDSAPGPVAAAPSGISDKRKAPHNSEEAAGSNEVSRKRAKSPEKQGSATSSLFKKLIDSPTTSGSSGAATSAPQHNQKPAASITSSGGNNAAGSPFVFKLAASDAFQTTAESTSAFQLPKIGDSQSTGSKTSADSKAPTFEVPKFGGGGGTVNFMSQFGEKAKKDAVAMEKEAREKRKAEDFDSDEDDEAEFDRKYEEEVRSKRAKLVEIAKETATGGFVPTFGSSSSNATKPTAESTSKAVNSWFPQSGRSTPSTVGGKSVFDTPVDPGTSQFGNPFSKADLDKANSDLTADKEGESEDDEDADEDQEYEQEAEEDALEEQSEEAEDDEQADPTYQEEGSLQINGDHRDDESDDENDLRAAMSKKKAKGIASSAAAGRSLFDRIEPNPILNPDGSTKNGVSSILSAPAINPFGFSTSSSAASIFGKPSDSANASEETPSTSKSLFGSTPSTSSNMFGSSTSSTSSTKPAFNPFGNILKGNESPVASPNPPASGLFGSGASTPVQSTAENNTTPKAGFALGSSPQDNTWKPDSPIRFGGTSGAPSVNVTGASPLKENSNAANSSQPPNPFASLFGAKADANNSLAPKSADVGFNFGGPPAAGASPLLMPSNLSAPPSVLSSAGTSRATSPGGTDVDSTADGDEETQNDEQLSLIGNREGEEDEDVLYEIRAKASESIPDPKWAQDGPAPNVWTSRGVGPLRVLKHKNTGKVRLLLRHDPGARVVLNCLAQEGIDYKLHGGCNIMFFVPLEAGKLQRWNIKVKNKDQAEELAKVINENKA